MHTKIKLITLLCTMAMMQTAMAQKANRFEFNIEQAVAYAKKNNVQVKNALLAIQAQMQTNKEITASALPTISGSIGTQHLPNVAVQTLPNFISPATYQVLIDQGVKDGNGNPIKMPGDFGFIAAQFGTKWNASAGVSLQQLLFDGQVFIGLQARKASIDFQEAAARVTEENIKTNLYKVYYQLVVSKTQIELLDANIKRLEKLDYDVKALYKNGFAERIDIDKIAVQLNNLSTEKIKALNSISMGYIGLKTLMGMPVADTLILTDTLDYTQIKEDITKGEYNYEDRRDFQYLSSAKQLNAFNVKRYELSKLPTVALGANYSKLAQRNQFNFFGKGDWFTSSSIGVNIAVPIFSGFAKDARIKKAKIELEQTNNQLENLKLNIDQSVEQARLKYKTAVATLDFQKNNMALAEKVYQQTKKKYEAGTGSNTEINASDVDLKAAQTNYISALYDAIIARVDYLTAIGKL
ncbi:TolC family protein [Sediminibacterium sp.]|uniref:TolC family protein n=1 Tax=Sediminibacterium sp. TaxID=1917865 RepID=UPI002733A8DC|nr:TolC family protein [Sediminibacterium sp.]MDP3394409.1 TolC family protein [Sediminibacterium sp.]MDP3568244.1 TolC family protein [Sediminibacterium sp.]